MLRIAAWLLALAQTPVPTVVDATDGTFTLEGGAKLEAIGVCRIDAEGVRCWSRDGAADAALTERVAGAYRAESGPDVMVRPGAKNRYVVFRRRSSLTFTPTDAAGGGMGTSFSVQDGDFLEWARYLLPPDAASFDAYVNLSNVRELPPVDLPNERGKTANVEGTRFEVGDARPFPSGAALAYSVPTGGKSWSITLSRLADVPKDLEFTYTPLDKAGKPIPYTDRSGSPVGEERFRAAIPQNLADPNLWKGDLNFQNARLAPIPTKSPEVVVLQSNVAPNKIAAIRITASERVRVRFPGLAADPR